jgi:dethiobiotin synthetase
MSPRARVVVVTGTDTGIGKTTVTRGLVRAIVRRGKDVLPLKWVETGCARDETGELTPSDGLALARAAKREHDIPWVSPLRFELPAAPAIASRAEGRALSIEQLGTALDQARAASELVVLEGAGGLLVPLTDERLFADACATFGLHEMILVTRDGLGTINHTLLSFEALTRRGLHVRAVVVNRRTESEGTDGSGSLEALRALLPQGLVLGPIPPSPGSADDDLAEAVEQAGLVDRVLDGS